MINENDLTFLFNLIRRHIMDSENPDVTYQTVMDHVMETHGEWEGIKV